VQKGAQFDPATAADTSAYFDNRVQIHHLGNGTQAQSHGAVFPHASAELPPGFTRHPPQRSVAWLQEDGGQSTPRGAESSIMGGSARQEMVKFGLPDRPQAPWAHIHPDHARPNDREDQSLRHPATEASNQRHSAIEQGIRTFVAQYGPTPIGRQLTGEINDGLFTNMEMTIGLVGSDDMTVLRHDQPFFSEHAGRSGDGTAIFKFLETEHFKNVTRSAGLQSELGEADHDTSSDSDEESETGDEISDMMFAHCVQHAAKQGTRDPIDNAEHLRKAAQHLAEAMETLMEQIPGLNERTSDFISATVRAYSVDVALPRDRAELLDILVAELVYDEEYPEDAFEGLSDDPRFSYENIRK
jgi:hypothetical protein